MFKLADIILEKLDTKENEITTNNLKSELIEKAKNIKNQKTDNMWFIKKEEGTEQEILNKYRKIQTKEIDIQIQLSEIMENDNSENF